MLLAPSLYEVVDKGRDLRPYESGVVYELRIADSVTVYAAAESRPNIDTVSGSALVALATVAAMISWLLAVLGGPRRRRRFHGLAAAGFAYLALDEFLAIHETVGHNLAFLSRLPGIERPDDLIIAAYLLPAVGFVYLFRDVLGGSRSTVRFFTAAIGFFALAGLADIAGQAVDELLEIASAACIVGGYLSLVRLHSRTALGSSPGADRAAAHELRD